MAERTGSGARFRPEKLLKFLRSVRLAAALILFLAASSALASLIPQGREKEFYLNTLPAPAGTLVLALGFDSFFRSPLFLSASGVFFLNLLVCTVHRLRNAHRKGSRKSWGPDLVHLGLLLLMAGGVVTVAGRVEQLVYLTEGRSMDLPGGGTLTVSSIQYLTYDDGRPKDWLTTVEAGADRKRRFTIEVNRPLRMNGLKIYQSSFYHTGVLTLEKNGKTYSLVTGRMVGTKEGALHFMGVRPDTASGPGSGISVVRDSSVSAVFEEWNGGVYTGERSFTAGDAVGDYRLREVHVFPVTGLTLVRDPGYIPVAAALLLVTVGLCWTFLRKLREEAVR